APQLDRPDLGYGRYRGRGSGGLEVDDHERDGRERLSQVVEGALERRQRGSGRRHRRVRLIERVFVLANRGRRVGRASGAGTGQSSFFSTPVPRRRVQGVHATTRGADDASVSSNEEVVMGASHLTAAQRAWAR